jgi:serine/threonine protein kinase
MHESSPQWQVDGLVRNRFYIVRKIGAGGMGEVYLAEDRLLGRKVALKLLPSRFTTDLDRLMRFEREARATSALNHPNIVTIYDVIRDGPTHFIVEEFIDGEPLRQRMSGARMCVHAALKIAIQVADVLSAVHVVNVVHRDIKPENIMLRPDGRVKILDFGLAKLTNARSEEMGVTTEPGVVLGTPGYMPPEQACGEPVDWRADIFSLGVVLYEMITGRPPFAGKTVGEVIASTLIKEPPHMKEYAPEVSDELQRIVALALHKDKEKRNQTAGKLMGDLEGLLDRLNVSDASKTCAGGCSCFPQQNPTLPWER